MTDDTVPVPDAEYQTPQVPQPAVSWRTLLRRVSTTPIEDVFKGRLTCRLDVDSVIAGKNLPAELAAVVQSVVRATRLWRSERIDVALELASHFRDGLEAGGVATELAERFGDARLVARLIRKSRIRCRPYWWRAWRYSLLGAALVVVLYVGLAARFFLSRPTISRNYIQEINDQVKAVPEDQRAWPLYRAALKARKPYPKLEAGQSRVFDEGWWASEANRVDRGSLAWKQMQTFVEENQASILKIHEATQRPNRGIIYGDPEDNPASHSDQNTPLFETSLAQVQELRTIARLLIADSTIACAEGDGNRLAIDFRSMIRVAEHSRGHWLVEELFSSAILQMAMRSIRDSLEDAPGLLTNDQLVEVAHQLAVFHGGGTIRYDLRGERSSVEDILQRCYTDDGHGNGSLTPNGLKLLGMLTPELSLLKDAVPLAEFTNAILAPAIMLRSMSRRESREVSDRLFSESQSTYREPQFAWENPDKLDEFFCKERMRYPVGGPAGSTLVPAISIPVLLFPAIQQAAVAAERLCQLRDGTLTAIALEVYHRRHGVWPTTLEQLVPRDLPELPLDRFTGQSLKYHVQDGSPVLYSCGMDLQDDGGRSPSLEAGGGEIHQQIFQRPATPIAPGMGYDWVLFPRPRPLPKDHE